MNIPWFKIAGVALVSCLVGSYLVKKNGHDQRRESMRMELHSKSPQELRRMMIAERFKGYPGPCPCPYDVNRRGHFCGRRSAYSRPGGFSPNCYANEISDSSVNHWIEQKVSSVK